MQARSRLIRKRSGTKRDLRLRSVLLSAGVFDDLLSEYISLPGYIFNGCRLFVLSCGARWDKCAKGREKRFAFFGARYVRLKIFIKLAKLKFLEL